MLQLAHPVGRQEETALASTDHPAIILDVPTSLYIYIKHLWCYGKPGVNPPSPRGNGCSPCTIYAFVQEEEEFVDSHLHLGLAEVQQGDYLEVQLAEQVGQLMHVHHGGFQVLVIQVGHVPYQQGHFVCGCQKAEHDCGKEQGT